MNNVDTVIKKCPKCGSQLNPKWRFCTLCSYRETPDEDIQSSLNNTVRVEHAIVEAKGIDGTLTLFSNRLRISRKGFMSFILRGLKVDREIYLSQISSVQFKKVGGFTKGYILISFIGKQETQRDSFNDVQEEHTIMFDNEKQPQFEYIKQEIDRRRELLRMRGHNSYSSLNLDELK